jgi:hypothetical protein
LDRLAKVGNLFELIQLGDLYAPDLTVAEAALLHGASQTARHWYRKKLDPHNRKLFDQAVQKALQSCRLQSPAVIFEQQHSDLLIALQDRLLSALGPSRVIPTRLRSMFAIG